MPEFLFAATDAAGNRIQGKATAAHMGAAVEQVAAMGYTLLQIEQAAAVPGAPAQQPPIAAPPPAPGQQTVQMPPLLAPASPATRPAQQPTVQMPPQDVAQPVDLLKADAAQRLKVEAQLRAIGMSPEEIQRFVNANAATYEADPSAGPQPLTASAPPPAARSKRTNISSLESFAAQLSSSNAAKTNATVREVDLKLPEFRESSTAETIQAEALLREASMLRRREKYNESELKVRQALALTPKDGAALELLGDILQGVGRVDEAIAAYKRATEADAKRSGAERKYGDLLMRQQNWSFADPEAVAPNRWLNSIVSLLPGVGQVLNGDWVKAGVFFALDLVCAFLLFYSPWAISKPGSHHASPTTLGSFALTIVTYIAAVFDANISAAKKRMP